MWRQNSVMTSSADPPLTLTAQTELPLVGRRADLAALRLALDSASEAKGHTIFLSGESGVGKTRLVQVLAREALRREMFVAVGGAYAAESGIPYGMISDALVPALRDLPPATLTAPSICSPSMRFATPAAPPIWRPRTDPRAIATAPPT